MVSSVACCSLCKMSLTPWTDAFLGVHFANHVAGLVVQFPAHHETHVFPCRAKAFISVVLRKLPHSQQAYRSKTNSRSLNVSHPTFY